MDCEGPALKTGTEAAGILYWINLKISHLLILISEYQIVGSTNSFFKDLICIFTGALKLGNNSVDLVQHEDWNNTLSESLSENSFGLNANAG